MEINEDGATRRVFLAAAAAAGATAIAGGCATAGQGNRFSTQGVQIPDATPPTYPPPAQQHNTPAAAYDMDRQGRVPDAGSARNSPLYRKISLMCYLLEEISYNDLYGASALPIKNFIPHLSAKIDTAPSRHLNRVRKGQIVGILVELDNHLLLSAYPRMTFGQLYTSAKTPGSQWATVANYFVRINGNAPRVNGTFCFPFAYDPPILQNALDRDLQSFGRYSLFGVITYHRSLLPGSDFTSADVRHAHKTGIFGFTAPSEPGEVYSPVGFEQLALESNTNDKPNGFCCVGGACDDEYATTADFCNAAESLGCSVASDVCEPVLENKRP